MNPSINKYDIAEGARLNIVNTYYNGEWIKFAKLNWYLTKNKNLKFYSKYILQASLYTCV